MLKTKLRPAPLMVLFLLAACAQPTAAPTPMPIAPSPTERVRVETPTASATQTQPAPTLTPSPSTGGSETRPNTATPSPEPITVFGPDNFPPEVNPLTGLKVSDPQVLERRPLAIKVSEFPRRVRPQFGLSLADVVFEHYAEAGVTRMTAIFLSHSARKVGSIRSARLIDTVLGEAYRAMLVTSGSSAGTLDRLHHTNFADRIIAEATGYDKCPPLCREGSALESTDNLFANTDDVWAIASQLGLNARQDLHGMAFAVEPPSGGQPGATIHIDFQRDYNVAEWRYDSASGLYARWVDTETVGALVPHADALDGAQLTAANVAVLYANHQPTDLVEDYGAVGHCGYEIQLWGSGPAKVFRDGQAYDATWVRFAQPDLIGLVGADNKVFALKPGNTWFEVINLGSPTTFEKGVFSARFKGPSQSANCPVNQATPTP
jgi:hypothetical protein